MRAAVIFNPTKSRRKLERFKRLIELPLAQYESTDPADLPVQARRAMADGHDVLLAAGGDGTILGVLNAIRSRPAVLGIVPLGTANDYAKELGITSIECAAAAFRGQAVRPLDAGRCTFQGRAGQPEQALFCLSAGVGFVAELMRLNELQPLRTLKRMAGNAAYVLGAAKLAVTFRGANATVKIDEQALSLPISGIEIHKAGSIGGMPVAPLARPDSGVLDACLVEDMSTARRCRMLLNLQFGARHLTWPDVQYFSLDGQYNTAGRPAPRRIEVAAERPLPVHLNGDFVGWTPATFEVLPGVLSVLAPVSHPAGTGTCGQTGGVPIQPPVD